MNLISLIAIEQGVEGPLGAKQFHHLLPVDALLWIEAS